MERANGIEEAASAWHAKRDSGNWTEDDQRQLTEWLEASMLHRIAFLRHELAWEDAGRLKALGAGVQSDIPPPPGKWNLSPFFEGHDEVARSASMQTAERVKNARRLSLALVAGVVLALALGTVTYLWPAGRAYHTDIGAVASVPMQDGSKITLNTDSAIRVALSDRERMIELKQGEAFFEVAKDPTRPFVVRAGRRQIIAVGTKFSVRREGRNDVQVVVTEGTVRVVDEEGGSSWPHSENRVNSAEPGTALLSAGTIARASDAGVLVQTKPLREAEEQLSWRAGILVFRNELLADAVAEFNRYNTRKIVIQDPAVAALRIEGNFRSNNVEGFARLLERGYAVRVQEADGRFILRAN